MRAPSQRPSRPWLPLANGKGCVIEPCPPRLARGFHCCPDTCGHRPPAFASGFSELSCWIAGTLPCNWSLRLLMGNHTRRPHVSESLARTWGQSQESSQRTANSNAWPNRWSPMISLGTRPRATQSKFPRACPSPMTSPGNKPGAQVQKFAPVAPPGVLAP